MELEKPDSHAQIFAEENDWKAEKWRDVPAGNDTYCRLRVDS